MGKRQGHIPKMTRGYRRLQKLIDRIRRYDELRKRPRTLPKEVRGDTNEFRALEITKKFLVVGEIPLHPIREAHITRHFSFKDTTGQDIVVPTDRGDVGFQVKSSRKFQEKFSVKYPSIPCIVVNEYISDERIYIEISSAIRHLYNQLQ